MFSRRILIKGAGELGAPRTRFDEYTSARSHSDVSVRTHLHRATLQLLTPLRQFYGAARTLCLKEHLSLSATSPPRLRIRSTPRKRQSLATPTLPARTSPRPSPART